jgi:hypothetical protein
MWACTISTRLEKPKRQVHVDPNQIAPIGPWTLHASSDSVYHGAWPKRTDDFFQPPVIVEINLSRRHRPTKGEPCHRFPEKKENLVARIIPENFKQGSPQRSGCSG